MCIDAKYHEFTSMGQKATFPLHSTETREMREKPGEQDISAKYDSMCASRRNITNSQVWGKKQLSHYTLRIRDECEKRWMHNIFLQNTTQWLH
jgi:hypothetical protein